MLLDAWLLGMMCRFCAVCVVSRLRKGVTVRRSEDRLLLFLNMFYIKVPREAKKTYPTSKLRAVGREQPLSSLFLRKGEEKMHVLLVAGSATSFGTFFLGIGTLWYLCYIQLCVC
jgi:hypothetical protein